MVKVRPNKKDFKFYEMFSGRLKKVLEDYKENWNALAIELEKIREVIKKGREAEDTFGFDPKSEMPFFGLIKQEIYGKTPIENIKKEDKDLLISLTHDVIELIKKEIRAVDFWESHSNQRRLKSNIISHLLTSYPSPKKNNTVKEPPAPYIADANEVLFGKRNEIARSLWSLLIISMGSDFMDIDLEKIIRTKRKTIALQITDDATLIVKAPFNINERTINDIILKHKKWIEKKKKEIEARDPKFSPKEFVNGEGFLFLGRYYKLKIVDEQEIQLRLENNFYLSRDALPQARAVFIEWYRKMASEKISERVRLYAQKRGFKYNKINITNAQKRWGSCNKNLNFPWRLIMAPLPVIDYVVIHELVHLEEKNHSKAFWDKVKMLMPEYEKYKDWLKMNSYLLRI